jgi:hypothetical protein
MEHKATKSMETTNIVKYWHSSCKQVEHATQKRLVDPRAHMASIAQKRNNFLEEL